MEASQSRTTELAMAVAIVSPSPENATESTLSSTRMIGEIPKSASHTRTVPSPAPVASQPVAGTAATDQTRDVWPRRRSCSRPFVAFHTRSTPS